MESIDERKNQLVHWLTLTCQLAGAQLELLPADASTRRYFRVKHPLGSWIAMDAPHPQDKCPAYVAIAKALKARGLYTPDIIAADLSQGFLLLTDFGDHTYLRSLRDENADALYFSALRALANLQGCREVPEWQLSPFTYDFMLQEWQWHKEWFLEKLLGLKLNSDEKSLDHCFSLLAETACAQPQVCMHRDYHSANLMVLGEEQTGILDFQDAFIGPVTYDLVSLLRDCYIDWPPARVKHWALQYYDLLTQQQSLSAVSAQTFLHWFDWMGVERHIKALFTFARKHVRDHQSRYLQAVPRTLQYLLSVSGAYAELAPLHQYYQQVVQPIFNQKVSLCVA